VKAKILITGAGGQVGHQLAIAASDYEVIALTRDQLDITQRETVFDTVRSQQPDIIINAAAYTAVDKAETETELAFAINHDGVKYLALACKEANIPLLHLSTDFVFDGEKEGAYTEDDPIAPLGAYSQSKADGEAVLREILPRHIILRTSWVFSASGDNFVKAMLRLGSERDELNIVDDQKGCPSSARSIAQTLLSIAHRYLQGETIAWGTYHYANQPETNRYQFAQTIFEMAADINNTPSPRLNPIPTSAYPTPARRPLNSVLDCHKIESTFGIVRPDWRDELREILASIPA
jgi:dTDP-4-dehydrorhamnose reductase